MSHLLAQWCILMLACLSVTLLIGQGGLLSFGQALYFGVGAYAAVLLQPLLPLQGAGQVLGLVSLPLLGGLAAAVSARLIAPWLLRHGGIAFAMMTLALGELVATLSQSMPQWTGGEAGLTINRSAPVGATGLNLGQEHVVVFVLLVYAVVGWALARRWVRSPLGLAWRASRDNPHRVQSLGYRLSDVRCRLLVASSGLCGAAGGLFALYFEHVTTDVFSAHRSSLLLLFALLGGGGTLWGAVGGSLLWVVTQQGLSQWTQGWMAYLGLVFMLLVVYAPQRVTAGPAPGPRWLNLHTQPAWQRGLALASGALGLVALIEMGYQWRDISTLGAQWRLAGWTFDITHPLPWLTALGLVLLPLLFALRKAKGA